MSGPTAFVTHKRTKASSRRHPWIYANSVTRVEGDYTNGDAVIVRGPEGRFLAHAWINDASKLRLRLVSYDRKVPIEPELLKERVRSAVALRREVLRLPERASAYRLIHSEGDGLPGLIVDLYGDVCVLTCSVLGLRQSLDAVLDALEEVVQPSAIIERDPGEALRTREGLPEPAGLLRGTLPSEEVEVNVDGLRFLVGVGEGQKTGLYLDQRDNIQTVAKLSVGKRVLDACCYLGGFGIGCAKAGAESVVMFDTSADAVANAQRHAELNGVADKVTIQRGSLFRELTRLRQAEEQFDVIVLDPPKFAKKRSEVRKARKGYLDANQLALRLLKPGGLLLSCSCSGAFSADDLEGVLRESATRTGTALRILERRGPGLDHPVDVHCPEGRYLKAILAQRH
ncbi:MAG: class I SAM-dependent rRNA methyltransferase [Planctomycetes bacterium]|nr:class I SAM-dependent rRNA methyltransferase [Planctomycetota bacterium]